VKAAAAALGAAAGFAGPDAAVAAALDETYQELLARTLTIAQDTAVRDKRRALRVTMYLLSGGLLGRRPTDGAHARWPGVGRSGMWL
jgi:hypothetical protein